MCIGPRADGDLGLGRAAAVHRAALEENSRHNHVEHLHVPLLAVHDSYSAAHLRYIHVKHLHVPLLALHDNAILRLVEVLGHLQHRRAGHLRAEGAEALGSSQRGV